MKKLFERCRNRLLASIAYSYVRHKKGKNEKIILLSRPIGDVVYAMSCVAYYKKQNPNQRITLYADEKNRTIVEAFRGYDNVVYFSRKSVMGRLIFEKLTAAKYFALKGDKEGIINTVPWIRHGVKDSKCLSLLKADFGLSKEAEIQYPNPNNIDVTSIKDFEQNKDHIAIINPYAHGGIENECAQIYDQIVALLLKRGFIVYTNVIGEQAVLKDTLPLRCGIEEFYSISNEIPLIVSVRTGLMDWAANTKSLKVIIYPGSFNDNWRRFYAMDEWNQDNIFEYVAGDLNESADEILELIDKKIGL